ncbi:MAG: molybdopterin-dependent oxidoreductase [Alphaproteobacteria bacterium]|nr:molybdopterin-dependent oxidoreductase [Alphaproteobacteria bacterium]
MRALLFLWLVLGLSFSGGDRGASAQQIAAGIPILNVVNPRGVSVAFDRDGLEKLPQHVVATSTPWSNGVTTFTGPRLRDLLARAGADGKTVSAVAINDYKVSFPAADAQKYDVIVAIKRDGAYMPVRDKGPLWIIYPLDAMAELRNAETHAKMIWQLKTLIVN